MPAASLSEPETCDSCGEPISAESRFCASCGAPATKAERTEVRKVVTVLFADIAGSTALGERLDPEAIRTLLGRHFGVARAVLERHGATVEKFIGDAVMAVFGIPELHEDDALRAVRAAVELRAGVAALNEEPDAAATVSVRIGINTGEVVAGDPGRGETLVTGDAVNVAARLEQAAGVGEIFIGHETYELARDALESTPVEPLRLKGKADPVKAHRLIAVAGEIGHLRNLEAPMVGRLVELAQLRAAWGEAGGSSGLRTVTVMAPAGVGKSRLVREFAESADARVLFGRCLAYGEGITYWPIRALLLEAAGIGETETAEAVHEAIDRLVIDDANAELLGKRVGAAIGIVEEAAPQEEIFWAVRRVLELFAARAPVLLVIEDIHWAEPTLLDLLDYLADMASGPMLLVTTARPELLEQRPGWGSGANRQLLRLEALGTEASEALLLAQPGGSAVPLDLRRRIMDAAEGNALFVEEMLAMLREGGQLRETDGVWQATEDVAEMDVPPTVRALLAARLDRLPSDERTLTSRASVVGRSFDAAALSQLAPPALQSELGRRLLSLVRKELLRPEQSQISVGDAFRFRHILIRDAAYAMLAKADRAEFHERFADWLEAAAGDRLAEFVEVAAYHLEQAAAYRTALGQVDDHTRRLEHRAALYLRTAGRAARDREDFSATASLLARSTGLADVADPERGWDLMFLSRTLETLGEHERARALDTELDGLVQTLPDMALRRRWRLAQASERENRGEPGAGESLDVVAREVYREAEDAGDRPTMAWALESIGYRATAQGRPLEELGLLRQARDIAEEGGDQRAVRRMRTLVANRLQFVAVPLVEAEAELRQMLAVEDALSVRIIILNALAVLAAEDLRGDEAWNLLAESRRGGEDLREVMPFLAADWPFAATLVAYALGDLRAAEDTLRPAVPLLEAAGDSRHLTAMHQMLAGIVAEQAERLDPLRQNEVRELAEKAKAKTPEDDPLGEIGWRMALAHLASFRGEHSEALSLIAGMADVVRNSQEPTLEAATFLDLAKILRNAGLTHEAREAATWARTVAERKGARAYTVKAEQLLAEIGAAEAPSN